MKTPKNIEFILKTLPDIVMAAVNEKNREKAKELYEKSGEMVTETRDFVEGLIADAGTCAHLILEMLEAPLKAAGIDLDLPVNRSFDKQDLEIYMEAEIHKALKIIQYKSE